ncbi:MAG TPA: hypothetical protein VK732_06430 [Verrucomicrobiae bacterium]|nr:hypothetical protein [Verrucomicrobiae bacterium]
MKLVTWSLATFHASIFVLAIVLFAYSRGGLGGALSGLNTFVGLGLFVALWATTYLTTARALAGLDLIASARDRDGYLRRTLRWGSRNGMAFLGVLGVVGLFAALSNTRPEQVGPGILFPALFIAPIALVVSAAVGGAVGLIFGFIDLALFALAGLSARDAEPTL